MQRWSLFSATSSITSSYPLDHSRRSRAAGLPVNSGCRQDCLLHNHNHNLNRNRNPLRGSRLRLRLRLRSRLGTIWDASVDKVTSGFPRGAAARWLRGGNSPISGHWRSFAVTHRYPRSFHRPSIRRQQPWHLTPATFLFPHPRAPATKHQAQRTKNIPVAALRVYSWFHPPSC